MFGVKNSDVIERLRELMADAESKSLRAYALSINVDPSQLSKVFSGERPITEKIVDRIVKKYNVRKEWLLYGRDLKYGQNGPNKGIESPDIVMEGGTITQPYLHDLLTTLKQHNAFLQDLVKSNLTGLSETQRIILAQVKAGLQYEAKIQGAGNKKKEAEVLADLNTLVAANLLGEQPKDSKAGQHM